MKRYIKSDHELATLDGFTWNGYHYTWNDISQNYQCDDPRPFDQIFGKQPTRLWNAVPKDAIWDTSDTDASEGQTKDVYELSLHLRYMGVDGLDILEFFMNHIPPKQCYDLLMQLADERGIDV